MLFLTWYRQVTFFSSGDDSLQERVGCDDVVGHFVFKDGTDGTGMLLESAY